MNNNKRQCLLILLYFGRFNNYFPLFLKSCSYNKKIDWLILTDTQDEYEYPPNVSVVYTVLEEVKLRAERKFGFSICMNNPYKLCDYKPSYGFLFEEYLKDYEYWGHCDCDLIFGNLDKMLIPLLKKGYDKLFAAGHLTLYKNNYENNRRFMKQYRGRNIYKEAYTTDRIFALDEDFYEDNVHSIFLDDNAQVYDNDLCMNSAVGSAKFIRDYYAADNRQFIKERYVKARYYWDNGNLFRLFWKSAKCEKQEFIYMHLQMRKMRLYKNVEKSDVFEIFPEHFAKINGLPTNKNQLRWSYIGFLCLYWCDEFITKVKRKIKTLKQRLG